MHNRAAFAALIFLFLRVELRFSQKRKNVTLCQEGAGDGSHPWTWVAQKYTPFLGGEKETFTGGKRRLLLFPLFCGKKSTPSRRDKKSRILYNISAEKHSVLIFILE